MRKLLLLLTAITLLFLFYSCPTGLVDTPEDDDTEETVSRNDVTILSSTYSDETAVIFYTEPSDSDFYATELTFTPTVSGISQPIEIKKGESLLSGTTSLGYLADLSNDTEYTLTLTAVYSDDSSAAGVSAKVTPIADVYPPENLTAVRGDQEVTLSWDEPADNNWFYINFEFTPEDGGYEQPFAIFSSETEYTIDGLTNGTEYTFNVYASDFFDLESSKVEITSTPSADLNPPALTASSVFLIDVDMDEGELAGTCEIEMAADESDIERYKLYWGSSETVKLDETAITSIDKTGADLEYTFSENTAVPSGAAYLLVYTENGDGETAVPFAYELKDFIVTQEPYTGTFNYPVEISGSYYSTRYPDLGIFEWDGTDFTAMASPSVAWASSPEGLSAFGNDLMFCASDGTSSRLWRLDPDAGTAGYISGIDSTCLPGIDFDGRYFFSMEDPTIGKSLYSCDSSGTVELIYDCDVSSDSQSTYTLCEFDSKLFL